MADQISKCPKCGALLEATLKLYLANVVIADGQVTSYDVLTPSLSTTDDFRAAVEEMVEDADGSELLVYCPNDHNIDISTGEVTEPE